MHGIISAANHLADLLWAFLGLPALLGLGLYFTWRFRGVQFTLLPGLIRLFFRYLTSKRTERGSHPLEMFFASIAGCIGISNVVAVCTAVQVGGPGALFWVWVTALIGMIIRYAEVFCAMRTRRLGKDGRWEGGPTYYLQKAFRFRWVAGLAALLFCIYGVDGYIFASLVHIVTDNFPVETHVATVCLLLAVLYGAAGGLRRLGRIATILVPPLVIVFLSMCGWVLVSNYSCILPVLGTIFRSAFEGHAAVGGFAGSGVMLALSQGVSWGCYAGDIGIGYASVIHSESSEEDPEAEASLGFLGVFVESLLICTVSILVVLVTGVWQQDLPAHMLVQSALATLFPYMELFMPILFLLLEYSTLLAIFTIGIKNAEFLAGKVGKYSYIVVGSLLFVAFAFAEIEGVGAVMRLAGCGLLLLNLSGFYRLREEITFSGLRSQVAYNQ